MSIKLDLDNVDFSMLCHCAFRYALGRMTYIPKWVAECVQANISNVGSNTIHCMIREIDEHLHKYGRIGMNFDTEMWLKFQKFLKEELEKRNEKV